MPDIDTASAETQYFSPEELPTVLRISEKLRRFVDAVDDSAPGLQYR